MDQTDKNSEDFQHYNILSLCGGNNPFALFAPSILERLDQKRPDFLNHARVFAGTSAGALGALALASEKDPQAGLAKAKSLLIQFSRLQPNSILKASADLERFLFDPFKLLPAAAMYIQSFVNTLYPLDELRGILDDEFGEMCLGDLRREKRFVVIPTFRLDGEDRALGGRVWMPRIFHTLDEIDHESDSWSLTDVALAAIPDPATFPVFKPSNRAGAYVDAYMFAANPGMQALTLVLDRLRKEPESNSSCIENISVLSIGCCLPPGYYADVQDDGNWGFYHWLVANPGRFFQALSSAGYVSTHSQISTLLAERYLHLDQKIVDVPLDVHRLNVCADQARELADTVDLAEPVNFLSPAQWTSSASRTV